MRYLIVASLLLSCSLCIAEDFPLDTNEIKSLTAGQAAEWVAWHPGAYFLQLGGLTSINKDVAQELAKFKGEELYLSAKALQTYEEVNGKSPSVMDGRMF